MYPKIVTIAVLCLVLMVVPPTLALRYTVHNTGVTYFEALTQCMKNGGYLAAIETPYQQTQIWNAIKKSGASLNYSWWISGTDLGMDGSWIWLSRNRPVGGIRGWTNWFDGEPKNIDGQQHCMRLNGMAMGTWYPYNCNNSGFYVCEYAD